MFQRLLPGFSVTVTVDARCFLCGRAVVAATEVPCSALGLSITWHHLIMCSEHEYLIPEADRGVTWMIVEAEDATHKS